MHYSAVHFSIASAAAWAPGIETPDAWRAWAQQCFRIELSSEPSLKAKPAMQRRRLGRLGKMALHVAYECLGSRTNIPSVFCSRHGEVFRSVELLANLASGEALSPTSFGFSVHNAIGGAFSIAREDKANNLALSAGESSIEHALIEACGLLADGEEAVLLVVYDCPLPAVYRAYCEDEQPFAWAWLIEPPKDEVISLSWSSMQQPAPLPRDELPAGLDVWRFHLRQDRSMERARGRHVWRWTRHG